MKNMALTPRKKRVVEKLSTLTTAAFGFVAALAWNEAIQTFFRDIFGTPNTLLPMVTYAIVVTIIAVMATVWIGGIAEKVK